MRKLNTFKTLMLTVLLTSSMTSILSGCTFVAATAAAVTAVDIVRDRRTTGSYIDDGLIEAKAKFELLSNPQLKGTTHFNVTSMNGVVLLTGEAPQPEQRTLAVDITQDVPQVRQVVNEVRVAGKSNLGSRSNDAWLTSKVKVKLFDADNLDATRIKVITESGIVYLMGLVSQIEGDSAAQAARTVSGVQRVVKVFEYIDQ